MSQFTPEYIRRALLEHAQACAIAGATNNQIVVNATMEAMQKQIQAAIPDKPKIEEFVK
jgi:hypothetical protein